MDYQTMYDQKVKIGNLEFPHTTIFGVLEDEGQNGSSVPTVRGWIRLNPEDVIPTIVIREQDFHYKSAFIWRIWNNI